MKRCNDFKITLHTKSCRAKDFEHAKEGVTAHAISDHELCTDITPNNAEYAAPLKAKAAHATTVNPHFACCLAYLLSTVPLTLRKIAT